MLGSQFIARIPAVGILTEHTMLAVVAMSDSSCTGAVDQPAAAAAEGILVAEEGNCSIAAVVGAEVGGVRHTVAAVAVAVAAHSTRFGVPMLGEVEAAGQGRWDQMWD